MGRINSKDFMNKKHIFAAPDVIQKYSKAELRRMAEVLPNSSIMPTLGKN
jgi:hypothetical protein